MMTKNNTPNPTDGRMKDKKVNAISDYLKPNMPLPQYLPYARFLLDADLSHTARAATNGKVFLQKRRQRTERSRLNMNWQLAHS